MNIKYRLNYYDEHGRVLHYGIFASIVEAETAMNEARNSGYAMPIEIVTVNS